jgi:hypothetical protein
MGTMPACKASSYLVVVIGGGACWGEEASQGVVI